MNMFYPKPARSPRPDIVRSIGKLIIAGEQAGFTIEEMIELLNGGLTMAALLDLIGTRLQAMDLFVGDPARKEHRV